MIEFRIEATEPQRHRFQVTMTVPRPRQRQRLSLPVWIPGSYLVREFARHLTPLQARQGGADCEVEQIDKATWEVTTDGRSTLSVSYEVHAFDTSVRAAFLDARRGFFNGTSVFLRAEGFEAKPHRVRIGGLPKGWQVATALQAVKVNAAGWGLYEAPDHDELIDHPVELGNFWRGEFTVRGVRHEFVVAGASPDFDGDRLLADTRQVCEAQIQFWHGRRKAAFDHYVFMLNAVEDGYGGLEHRRSTALICARKDLPRKGRAVATEAYTTLLGLISHEYFHTWNVKRLKPAGFDPIDLSRENMTRMLWFFEGFTSYYDDQFLLRTKLIDAATYLKLIGKTVNQVRGTPGRLTYSVGQASFDAWTRYYRPDENTANATVSYYTKGSLVALCLDLALRLLPVRDGHQPKLDGVMERLWRLGRSITEADVAQALGDEAQHPPDTPAHLQARSAAHSWAELLHRWTETCEELPLSELLASHGVQWQSKAAPLPQKLGVRLSDAAGALKVQAVMRHGHAESAGLSAGDELLALDGWRLKRTDDLLQWHDGSKSQALLISRDQRLETLTLPALGGGAAAPFADDIVTLALPSAAAEPAALARRKAWLRA
ncbi:M61 family metallopeptidase [Aquabacterium parvum]|uniref:M61 family metallopeptidase n=1 Tax=Aquabacterium parvum TaxID=70584 RepID=UPI000718E448|nr:PDZ domain-containing protein [Aquabacterium parvum]MBU0918172.1 PDZ domain-containing protein [Gammaproteobacteria bacterium]